MGNCVIAYRISQSENGFFLEYRRQDGGWSPLSSPGFPLSDLRKDLARYAKTEGLTVYTSKAGTAVAV